MFSNKTQKLLALQNDYIERINKNAVKLDNQLNFLMEIQNHIGQQIGGTIPIQSTEKIKSGPPKEMNTNTPTVKTTADEVVKSGVNTDVKNKDNNPKELDKLNVKTSVQENKTGSLSDTTDFQKMEVYNKISEGISSPNPLTRPSQNANKSPLGAYCKDGILYVS